MNTVRYPKLPFHIENLNENLNLINQEKANLSPPQMIKTASIEQRLPSMETLTQNVSIPKPVFHSSTFFPSKNPNSSFENDFKAIQDSDDDSLNQNDFLSEDSGTNSG